MKIIPSLLASVFVFCGAVAYAAQARIDAKVPDVDCSNVYTFDAEPVSSVEGLDSLVKTYAIPEGCPTKLFVFAKDKYIKDHILAVADPLSSEGVKIVVQTPDEFSEHMHAGSIPLPKWHEGVDKLIRRLSVVSFVYTANTGKK